MITLHDLSLIFAYPILDMQPGAPIQILDGETGAHFRWGSTSEEVELGGDYYGNRETFLKQKVTAIEILDSDTAQGFMCDIYVN